VFIKKNIIEKSKEVVKFLENYRFREALSLIFLLLQSLNKYFNDSAPWNLKKTEPELAKNKVNNAIICIINISILLRPFLPSTSEKIMSAF
jgi:methionyl-tRNA synthetase